MPILNWILSEGAADPNDLKDRDIVRALANLEQAGVPVANELHILNHWR